MISNRKEHAEHPLAGQNTQQSTLLRGYNNEEHSF